MDNKIGVSVGRDKEVKEDNVSILPEKPKREFRSKIEQKVIELLESKHPVSPARWTRLELEGRDILKKLVMDREYPLRTKAITSLVLSNDKDHVELLKEIISNRNEDNLVRAVSVISLGMSKSPMAGRILPEFINDQDEFIRAKVVEALGKVGGKEEHSAVISSMNDKSPLVRSNAKNASNLMDFRLNTLKRKKQDKSK